MGHAHACGTVYSKAYGLVYAHRAESAVWGSLEGFSHRSGERREQRGEPNFFDRYALWGHLFPL